MSERTLQKEVGLVRAIKQYLVSIEGLPSAKVYDVIVNKDGKRALVTALSHDAVEAMVLDQMEVKPGQQFEIYPETNQLSIGNHLFGRIINALGDPIDSLGAFPPKNKPFVLEKEAGDLAGRESIFEQLVTGFSMIDTVLPLGKGQRQLLMGSVRSGTETFCKKVIHNQLASEMICIYATINKPETYVRRLASDLLNEETKKNTIILASTSEDPVPLSTIAPSVAIYIAEHFCDEGKDVLLILDDLYTHAKNLREIALLEGHLPGRESYPGDIFYKQAHLIERAGNFKDKGSITLLPILQTDIESTTDLIMTNIMGTTDGHYLFSPERFARGIFPPVQEEESVTRVGKHTQTVVQKQLSTAIVSLLADASEQRKYTQFGTQVSEATRSIINMGESVRLILNQVEEEKLSIETQAILLSLVFTTLSSGKDAGFFEKNYGALRDTISKRKEFEGLRKAVYERDSLDSFIAEMEKHTQLFKKVCR